MFAWKNTSQKILLMHSLNVFWGKICPRFPRNEWPTDNYAVRNLLETTHRPCKTEFSKKEPITTNNIKDLQAKLIGSSYSLAKHRTFVITLIGFAGFLRYTM